MEYEYRREHSEHIAQADHRVGHTERKPLEDVHPQDRAAGVAEAASQKPPVHEQAAEKRPRPLETSHFLKGELEKDLASGKQKALGDGQCQQSPHRL